MTEIGGQIVYTVAIPNDADPTQLNFWLREGIDGTEFEWTYATSPVEGVQYPTGANPITRLSAGNYRLVWVARKPERIVGTWEASGSVAYSTTVTTFVRHSEVRSIDDAASANVVAGASGAGIISGRRRGEYYVDDFGAVARPITDGSAVSDEERTANVTAFRAAFAAALGSVVSLATDGGGVIYMGPGLYYTNDWVGYDLTVDLNCSVTLQGIGAVSGIVSNNFTASVLKFSTTGGNIRDLLVQDVLLHGGREGLQLFWCAYSRFNRVWFWGSKNFALQDEFGSNNFFHECRFDESAQGASDGNPADAAIFVNAEETISNCNFGEFCGGIVVTNGEVVIEHCLFHDCLIRRGVYHSYFNDSDGDLTVLLDRPAAISLSGGYAVINGCTGGTSDRFVLVFRGVELIMSACRVLAGTGGSFAGFIDVWPDGVLLPQIDLALHVSACTFVFDTLTGFLIQDLESSLRDAIVSVQAIINPGGAMTALSTSAPALLNPGSENNSVTVRTFSRS